MSKRFQRSNHSVSPRMRRMTAASWLAAGGLLLAGAGSAQGVTILVGNSSTVNNPIGTSVTGLGEKLYDGTFNDSNLNIITKFSGLLSPTGPNAVFTGLLTNTDLDYTGATANTRSGNLVGTDGIGGAWFGEVNIGGASPLAAGTYTFGTRSDDGSVVFIDLNQNRVFEASEMVVNNLGSHGAQDRVGTVNLANGSYDIAIGWYEGSGGEEMEARFAAGTVTQANYATMAIVNPLAVGQNGAFTKTTYTDQDLSPDNIVVDGGGSGGSATLNAADPGKTTYNALKFQNTGGNPTTFIKDGAGTVRVQQGTDNNAIGANDTVQVKLGDLQMVLKNGVNPMGAGSVQLNGGTFTVENAPVAQAGLSARLFSGDRGETNLNFSGAFTHPNTGNVTQPGLLSLAPTISASQTGALNYDENTMGTFFGYTGNRDQYQAVWTGLYTAAVSGVHNFGVFRLNGGNDIDDHGSIYFDLNQNSIFDPGEGFTTAGQGSLAVNLVAGQAYTVAFGYNEDGGNDSFSATFNEPAGGTFTTLNTLVNPNAQVGRWSTFQGPQLAIDMSATDIEVLADSVINPVTFSTAKFGGLSFAGNSTLASQGAAQGISFTDTTIDSGVTAVGFNTLVNTNIGSINFSNNGSLVTITKTGAADLVVSGGATNLGAGSAAWNVQAGRLVAVHDGGNPLGNGTGITLANSTLALSIKSGNALETFNNAINVTANSTLTAGLHGDGLTGPKTARVGSGSNGVSITGANRLTVTTTDNYTIDFAGAVTGTGIFDITNANATFSGVGANVGTLAVNGSQIGLIGDGTLKVTAGGTYMFNPTAAVPSIAVGLNLGSLGTDAAANVVIGDNDVFDGVVNFSGNNTYTGSTRIRRGELQMADASNLTSGNLNFNSNNREQGALLVTKGTFARNIGTAAGQVQFSDAGGFGARGGNLIVTLNGGSQLAWETNTAGGGLNQRDSMQFGGQSADSMVELTNSILIRPAADVRFQVADNLSTKNDFLRLSGQITGGNAANVMRFNETTGANNMFSGSLIEMTNASNNYLHRTQIDDAVLRVGPNGAGLSAVSNLRFSRGSDTRMAILESSGIFARTLGTADGGVHFEQNAGGGFSAFGGDLSVRFNGDDGTGNVSVNWGGNTADVADIDNRLQLGSIYATHVTTITNDINGTAGGRAITLFDNADVATDFSRLSGDLTNFAAFETFGTGTLETTGTIQINTSGDLKVNDFTRMIVRGNATIGDLVAEEQGIFEIFSTVNIANAGGDAFNGNNGGTIIIRSGGVVNVNDDVIMNNGGVFRVESGGTATLGDDIDINTGGQFIVDAGGVATANDAIIDGRLIVNGNVNINAIVDINNNGTLGGSGTMIVGTDIDILSGGKVAPGNSPGLLTLQRTTVSASAEFLDFNTGSILEVEFAQAGFDQIMLINGMLDLDTDWNLRLISDGRGILPSEELYLILFGANAGILTGQDLTPIITLVQGPNGNPWGMPASNVTLGVNSTGVFITGLSVAPTQVAVTVPEPATLLLAGIAGMTLASRRRRTVH